MGRLASLVAALLSGPAVRRIDMETHPDDHCAHCGREFGYRARFHVRGLDGWYDYDCARQVKP